MLAAAFDGLECQLQVLELGAAKAKAVARVLTRDHLTNSVGGRQKISAYIGVYRDVPKGTNPLRRRLTPHRIGKLEEDAADSAQLFGR